MPFSLFLWMYGRLFVGLWGWRWESECMDSRVLYYWFVVIYLIMLTPLSALLLSMLFNLT